MANANRERPRLKPPPKLAAANRLVKGRRKNFSKFFNIRENRGKSALLRWHFVAATGGCGCGNAPRVASVGHGPSADPESMLKQATAPPARHVVGPH